MLVIFLQDLGLSLTHIGLMFTLTLLGDAIISILLTTHADKFGRKITLIVGSLLSVITSIIFAISSSFWILLISAIIGVISPSGNEIGPFMAIEISSLSQVTRDVDRTKIMAWYNLFGCFSSATGALICGYILNILNTVCGLNMLTSCRVMMVVYAILQIVQTFLFFTLRSTIEVPNVSLNDSITTPVSQFMGLHKSKYIVFQLCCLFVIDSFAGSFILQSIVSDYFYDKYHTDSTELGRMVFICNLVAGISALFAARLADNIGLILTMVVTHLPSNILLILVPLMPNETSAIVMLCIRYSISQMDVPTRNAYVQGVVDADERSAANGVTNVVRSLGACLGPYFAGILYAQPQYRNYPFYIAGGLKIIYDLLLLWSFKAVKPDHEIMREEKVRGFGRSLYGKTASENTALLTVRV